MFHCSVVIPTKNAMPGLRRVVGAVMSQRTPWPFELVIIDSGSSDGTVEYCVHLKNTRLLQVAPAEFGHGRTRNRAIAATTSPFVAMLTQDAEPANSSWLFHLVAAVEQRADVAGAFGPHYPYADADVFTKRDLTQHFVGLGVYPGIVNRFQESQKYLYDIGYRQVLHFFSDNNACVRRSVWERIPYPDVDFAEDQLWADAIIHAGYSKAYARLAAVYHSHNYTVWERFQRSYDESAGFRRGFGYRLDSSIRQLRRSIGTRCRRDMHYCFGRLGGQFGAGQFARQCISNAAAVCGTYVGAHDLRVPRLLRRYLSWDAVRHRRSKKNGNCVNGTALHASAP